MLHISWHVDHCRSTCGRRRGEDRLVPVFTHKIYQVITSRHHKAAAGAQPDSPIGTEVEVVRHRVFVESVGHMVLMVVATVAPEIVLTTMEIIDDNFQAGEIGPSAIVGSAAWNYLITVGLCVGAVRSPSTRRIENTAAFWATLAYSEFSPNVLISFYRQIF